MSYTMKSLYVLALVIIFTQAYAWGHGVDVDYATDILDGKSVTVSVDVFVDEHGVPARIVTSIDQDDIPVSALFHMNMIYQDMEIFTNDFQINGSLILNGNDIVRLNKETQNIISLDELGYGKYHFEINITEINDIKIINTKIHTLDVSKAGYTTNGSFTIKSYFDKITDISYSPEDNSITIRMPFNWKERAISHIPIVHVEVQFPKNFTQFMHPGYSGMVNGVELFKSSINLDDFTLEERRIVHFILANDHIQVVKNGMESKFSGYMEFTLTGNEEIQFPLTAITRNEEFQVDLTISPMSLEPNEEILFILTFRDPQTGYTLRQTSYDFKIIQNDVTIYEKSSSAIVGGSFEKFTFAEGQSGPIRISVDNIRGTNNGVEFGLVVVPEFGPLAIIILGIAILGIIIIRLPFFHSRLNSIMQPV